MIWCVRKHIFGLVSDRNEVVAELLDSVGSRAGLDALGVMCDEDSLGGLDDDDAFLALLPKPISSLLTSLRVPGLEKYALHPRRREGSKTYLLAV